MQKAESASVAQLKQLAVLARLARDNNLNDMEKLVAGAPSRTEAQLLFGLSLHRFGRYEEAEAVLRKSSRTSEAAVRSISSALLERNK